MAAPAALAPTAFAAPAPLAPATIAAPAPLAASPLATIAAPAPLAPTAFAAPAFAAPFAVASPVFQAPVVKTVVETPAAVTHLASPLVAPAASVVGLTSHDCVTPHGCAVRAALLAGTPSATFGHVTSTRIVKREAEPTAEASPDAEVIQEAVIT